MIVRAAQLARAVALVLWSKRMIRTGVERACMPELKSALKRSFGNTAATGSFAAKVTQGAAAVALSGMLAPHTALALVVGVDLGSALITGVLVLALVFISLDMSVRATAPIGDNAIIQNTATFFGGLLVGAYVLGAVLTWAVYTSLAAVLALATNAIVAPVAMAMIIEANRRTSGDAQAGQQLLAEKDGIRLDEHNLQVRHLKHLQRRATANIHQETLRVLTQINAALTYVACPIAKESGDILESRMGRPRRLGGAA